MHLSTGIKKGTFGERLKEERERIGFKSQTALGDALDKAKKTIINWEQDVTAPDASDLLKMHELKFNISYLLLGSGHEVRQETAAYTPSEHAALAIRTLNLSDADAKMIVQIARRLKADDKG